MTKRKIGLLLLASAFSSAVYAAVRPSQVDCTVRPMYGYRPDGTPGRIVTLKLKGGELDGELKVDIVAQGAKETQRFTLSARDSTELELMLPSTLPTDRATAVTLLLHGSGPTLERQIALSPMRHWNVYLYNHAHVDIGYTNTHKNVETLHKTNIVEGIKLAEETKHHPEGSRYVWNPEVGWPLERLWHSRPDYRDTLIDAIRKGQVCVDASYLNLNTSICSDEELFHVFRFTRRMQRLSGRPADVFQQFDIPGISWGLIPVMVQQGVRYIISWPNTDRAGHAHKDLDGRPFWWVGPDGRSKVLFFQPGGYGNSGSMVKGGETGRPWFGQRDPKKVPPVIRTGSADVDFTDKLEAMEQEDYPYDFAVFSWSLWDNNPPDADIPFAVKAWNEKYAYPKIRICGGHEIMSMIETKYGDRLPVVSGDYTEYWTDGLGTAADLTARNRRAKERLVQAETIWSMLGGGDRAPRADFDEAWRYILLGSEHTWCFENPTEPYFQNAIWKVKQAYFHEAEDRSIDMLNESLAPATDKSDGGMGAPEGPANGGIAVFNTHSWPQSGVVRLAADESRQGNKVVDEQGGEVLAQRLSTGELLFLAADVPALGSRHFRVVEGECSLAGPCRVTGTTLENGVLEVRIDPATGNLAALTRKGISHNYIDREANTFAWLPANEDAPRSDTVVSIEVAESGPLAVELRVVSRAHGCRSLSRSVRLLADQPWVELSNVVDKLPWRAKDGIHFGFSFNVPQARTRVDIPWGVMEVEKDQWPQANRNWMAMQRWVDISNATHGVTWCSPDAPLFEHGARHANIALGWGSQGNWIEHLSPSATIYSWVMNNHWHTNFPLTQEGPVEFRYRLLPHDGYDAVQANRFGVEQAQPLVYVTADQDPQIRPVIGIDNPTIYSTIVKSLECDRTLIVRLRSVSDRAEHVTVSFPGRKPVRTTVCGLEEEAGQQTDGRLTLAPFGMVTLRLEY